MVLFTLALDNKVMHHTGTSTSHRQDTNGAE